MFTPKQERNGTDIGADGHNTAVTDMGPMPDVAPLIDQAESAAATYSGFGKTVFDGGDLDSQDLVLGATWDWASGLAVEDAG